MKRLFDKLATVFDGTNYQSDQLITMSETQYTAIHKAIDEAKIERQAEINLIKHTIEQLLAIESACWQEDMSEAINVADATRKSLEEWFKQDE